MPSPAVAALRRRPLVLAGAVVVVTGLTVSTAGSGPVADLAGDALYAALVWVLIALPASGWSLRVVTAATVGVCTVIELAQLTGLPAQAAAAWWPARFLLGTTFAWADLAAYAVGAVAAGCAARTLTSRSPR